MTCETLPLCPDTTVASDETRLTEPVEVGPFDQGIVFLKLQDAEDATVVADVGISPTGYESWTEHWTPLETMSLSEPGMHAVRLTNFGNWLRLRLQLQDSEGTGAVLAWFVGEG
jgi:hypothetical protein